MKPAALLLAPVPDFLTDPLSEVCQVHDYYHTEDKQELLNAVGPQIRAVIMYGASMASDKLLDRLPALEIISVYGVGYDGVPLDYCRRRGIHVTNTPDVLTDDVADIAMGLVLMTSRRLAVAERFVRAGQWLEGTFPLAHALRGKTAGIVGLGRIGKAIGERLSAHGMKVAYHGRTPQAVDYPYCESVTGLAEMADFLIVACPGGPGTRHLINAEVLAALGPEGTLINIARGSVVDEQALVEALETGAIRGAGLDVFEKEPEIPAALLGSDRVVLLPHVGSGTHETRRAMAMLCVANVAAHFANEPLLTPVS
ncbi:lactate dehydrogenase-like 2-hydroxyacid dehydrogenase [Prosthecobacter fusiformis]|uniref:Lactate dehydrogenase-like 2-hydroxyacid dehydrogenase n=1 Tax=Prosthecobacter fusiformis TaxID=48464 RepID=A0A4R7S225_9BACT|nr:2-hydroxyacid dehydrogenase [Prosthecobacter fusiformis]TDU71275.1 lactate dehydrogenase-like 2-hydroxyacid dehydrogenase [Prosthecobacter fusiformis]